VKNPGLWRGENLEKAGNYIMKMPERTVGEIRDAFQKAKKQGLKAIEFAVDRQP